MPEVSLVAQRIAELGLEEGVRMDERDEPWLYQLTDADHEHGEWWIATNGEQDGHEIGPNDGMKIEIDPFHLAAWCNGWLVFHAPPTGGTIVRLDSEDELLEILEAELDAREAEMAPEGGGM